MIFIKKNFSEKKSFRQNRISSETAEFPNFFADSFLKLNYLQVHVKKIDFLTYEDCHVPKLKWFIRQQASKESYLELFDASFRNELTIVEL
jgi:hypothetical protein